MLDLSPEKLMVLLAVGLVVLGPARLPAAARSLAHGLARARRLAANLTDPITTAVAEPRRAVDEAVSELRSTIVSHPIPGSGNESFADPSLN